MTIAKILEVGDKLNEPPQFVEAVSDQDKLPFVAPGLQSLVQDRT